MATGGSLEHKVRVIFEVVTGNLQQRMRQNVNQIRNFGTTGQAAGRQASRGLAEAGQAGRNTNDELRRLLEQLRRTGNAAETMSRRINTAFKTLLTGFVTKQIFGFGQTAVTEYGKTQTALGEMASLGYEDLEGLRQAAVNFSNVWSGTAREQFISSAYDIKSGIASLSDEGVAQFTEMAGLTAKATKASIDEMTSLFATGYGIYRKLYDSDFAFGENFAAGISKSVQQFKTKGSEMASYLSTLGSSAAQAGAQLDEILSIGGLLQATMTGSEAATKYNSFLKNAVKAAKTLGLTFTDANNQLLSAADILQVIHDQYGDVLQVDEKYELAQAFGDEEAVKLIENLYDKIKDIRDAQGQVNVAMKEGMGFVESMASHMNRGVLEKVAILKQSWSNLLDKMGEEMAPGVMEGLEGLNRTILKLQESADFAAVGHQIGVVVSKLAELMNAALESGALEKLLGGLADHLDELIGLVVKGTGAWLSFQAAAKLAEGAFEVFSTIGGAAESINEITDMIDKMTSPTGSLHAIVVALQSAWTAAKTFLGGLPVQVKIVIAVIAAVIAIIGALIALINKLGISWSNVGNTIHVAANRAQIAVYNFCEKAMNGLENLLRRIPLVGDAMGDMAAGVSQKLRESRGALQEAVNARINSVADKAGKDSERTGKTPQKAVTGAGTSGGEMEAPNLLLGNQRVTGAGGGGKTWTIQDSIDKIADKYEPELDLYETRADLAEKQDDYKTEKDSRQSMVDVLNQQVKELLGLENTQTGRNKMVVEAARNRLLSKIAEITDEIRGGVNSMVGEFNKPAGASALNYYGYMMSTADPNAIGNVLYGGNNNISFYMDVKDLGNMSLDKAKGQVLAFLEAVGASFFTQEELKNMLTGVVTSNVTGN